MNKFIEDVKAFHQKYGLTINEKPTIVGDKDLALRSRLLDEECDETLDAISNDDLEGIADGLVDLIYVAIGAALTYGIPLEECWDEVQRSNMSKTGSKDWGGKITKGPDFVPPQINKILEKHSG